MTAKSGTTSFSSDRNIAQNGCYRNIERQISEDPEDKREKLRSKIKQVCLRGKSWNYRGEGGANLVISLPNEKQIVRFSKSKYLDKDHDAKILEIAFYANNVMRHALGHHYTRELQIGRVSDVDFKFVRSEAEQFRPIERCKKSIMSHLVILSPDCVFLTSDFAKNTEGDTFSIEIKPKQGWHSSKATCASDLCNRCLKQFAKLYQGKIRQISHYCPLDLFSGDRTRMKRAIFDLFENPHNRFKIYKNGNLIYTENHGQPSSVEEELQQWLLQNQNNNQPGSGLHHLAGLLCTVLLSNFEPTSNNIQTKVDNDLVELTIDEVARSRKYSCDTRNEPLPQGCILSKVLKLQKHAEISDQDAKTLCEKLHKGNDDLEKLHQLILWHPMTVPEQSLKSVRELEGQGLKSSDIDNLQQLQRFLLSVTAKDVSLLITFRQIKNEKDEKNLKLPSIEMPKSGPRFRVMISVIDLDPKPVHRVATWVKRKEEWLKIYQENTQPDVAARSTDSPVCEKLLAV